MKAKISERIGLPKGYRFEIIQGNFNSDIRGPRGCLDNNVDVRLWHDKKCVGHVQLSADWRNGKRKRLSYTTHSYLAPRYRNKGLGSRIYARAILWCLARKYKVHSYYSPSPEAQRVWKGKYLASKFNLTSRPIDPNYGYGEAWNVELKDKRR